jgi:hypothetical protein
VFEQVGVMVCGRGRVHARLRDVACLFWPGFYGVGMVRGGVLLSWECQPGHSPGVAYLRGQSLDFPRACLENYLRRPSLAVRRGN